MMTGMELYSKSVYMRGCRVAYFNGVFKHRDGHLHVSDRQLIEMIVRGYLKINHKNLLKLTPFARREMIGRSHVCFLRALHNGLKILYREEYRNFSINWSALKREGFITVSSGGMVILQPKGRNLL